MSKRSPPVPVASAVGPCPTVIHIVGRLGTESLSRPSHHPTSPRISRRVEHDRPQAHLHPCVHFGHSRQP